MSVILFGGVRSTPPNLITGLTGWWDCAQESFSNDDPVATWTDRSSSAKNFTQGTAGYRPLFKTGVQGGQSALRFDGADDYMHTAASSYATFVTNSAFTCIAVASVAQNTAGAITYGLDSIWCAQNGNGSMSFTTDSSGGYSLTNYDGTVDTATTAYTASTWSIFAGFHSGGNIYSGSNKAQFSSLASAASGNTSDTNTYLNIGSTYTGGGVFTSCDIAELILYNVAISADDYAALVFHLSSKYGIAIS